MASLGFDGPPWLLAFANGRLASVESQTFGNTGRASLLAIDSATGALRSHREMDRHFADVLVLPREWRGEPHGLRARDVNDPQSDDYGLWWTRHSSVMDTFSL